MVLQEGVKLSLLFAPTGTRQEKVIPLLFFSLIMTHITITSTELADSTGQYQLQMRDRQSCELREEGDEGRGIRERSLFQYRDTTLP